MQPQAGKMRAACVQFCATCDQDANQTLLTERIRQAAADEANYIQTPEMSLLLETDRKRLFEQITAEKTNQCLAHFRSLAKELGIWLHLGSIAVALPIQSGQQRAANRAYLIAPDGSIAATYDKMHMFDVDLPSGETYRESNTYQAGDRLKFYDLPFCRLGLGICYDMRFPAAFRALAQAGCEVLTAPSAFTKTTGEAHWHSLLKARAIENGCFMVAAAQNGYHECGRQTYGHSLIISPWGNILAECTEETGIILADLDMSEVSIARSRIPSLQVDKDYAV